MITGRLLGICTLLLSLTLLTTVARADSFDISFSGTTTADTGVSGIFFSLTSTSTVTFVTESYAGGVNGLGKTIPEGGFDPLLSLFSILPKICGIGCSSITGNFIALNDNGGSHVPADSVTGKHFDSFLQTTLAPGAYGIFVSEYNNPPLGPTLADGFALLSSNPYYTASADCPHFLDSTGSCRKGFDAGEIIAVDATSGGVGGGGTSVAEPSSFALLLAGLASLSFALQVRNL